ncbi:MAG: ATP cone domain-containing protein [Minisyncoccia bacterium]
MPHIVKSDGGVEEFRSEKLVRSLVHSGADESVAEGIAGDVEQEVREGMSTHEIYARAFERLRDHRQYAAARYSLKRAILEFGPSGFPFESYLASLFRAEGYETAVDVHVRGRCVEHEVDVVLSNQNEKIYVEAKFHNTLGFKTDLQVALYVEARLEDILAAEGISREHREEHGGVRHAGMIVTNTKFTSLAVAYAECRGLPLLAWKYPAKNNLHDRIARTHLYPVTALTTLSRRQKQELLTQRIVLVNELAYHEAALTGVGVSRDDMRRVLEEASAIIVLPTAAQE